MRKLHKSRRDELNLKSMSEEDLSNLASLVLQEVERRITEEQAQLDSGYLLSEMEKLAVREEEVTRRKEVLRQIALGNEAEKVKAEIREAELQAKVRAQERVWSEKKGICIALQRFGFSNTNFEINMWSKDEDKRIYFQHPNKNWTFCLYITGNHRYPPNAMIVDGKARLPFELTDDKFDAVRRCLILVSKSWKNISIESSTALNAWVPYGEYSLKYMKQLKLPGEENESK